MEIFERSDSTTSCRFDSLGFDSEPEIAMNVFDITGTKHPTVARLQRWRQAALVLNGSRRFRYALDLRNEEKLKIRNHAYAIRAAFLFKEATKKKADIPETVYRRGPGCRSKSPQATTVGRCDVRKLKNRDGVEVLQDELMSMAVIR